MIRRFKLIVSLFFILVSILSCGSKEKKQEKVVVKIADAELTLEALKVVIPPQKKRFLTHEQVQNYIQRWIDNELIYQEAVRQGMDNSAELDQVLKRAKKDFLIDELLDSLLNESISISEQEIINYYGMNKDNFIRAKPEIRALHILVSDEKKAKEIRQRLRKEDFEKVAREVSLDYARKKRIDMGYFNPDDVVPEIASSVFRFRVGSITRPIRSEFGYHIFKIMDKKSPDTVRDLEDVKDQIIDRLLAKKGEERYKDFMTGLKGKTEVKTNFEYLNELYLDSVNVSPEIVPDSL